MSTRLAQARTRRLVAEAGSLAGLIAWKDGDFEQLKGIGRVKALQLVGRLRAADPGLERRAAVYPPRGTGADSAPGAVVLRTYDALFEYRAPSADAPLSQFASWPVSDTSRYASPAVIKATPANANARCSKSVRSVSRARVRCSGWYDAPSRVHAHPQADQSCFTANH